MAEVIVFSQNIENQQITSTKYSVLMLHVHQNERKKDFGRFAMAPRVISAAIMFSCSCIIAYSLVRRYEQTGISIKAQG